MTYQSFRVALTFKLFSARKAMEKMTDLHNELGDVKVSLKELHKNPNNTDIGMYISFSYIHQC